jgi:hypothetical protein
MVQCLELVPTLEKLLLIQLVLLLECIELRAELGQLFVRCLKTSLRIRQPILAQGNLMFILIKGKSASVDFKVMIFHLPLIFRFESLNVLKLLFFQTQF